MTVWTERLRLHPFAPADEDTLFAMFRDDGLRRFLLDGALVDRDWVRAEIESSMRRFNVSGTTTNESASLSPTAAAMAINTRT